MLRILGFIIAVICPFIAMFCLAIAISDRKSIFFAGAGLATVVFFLAIKAMRNANPVVEPEVERKQKEFISALNGRHSVTPLFLAAILGLIHFLLVYTGKISTAPTAGELYQYGGGFGHGAAHGQPWRLFTAMFLHGSYEHLVANMIGLWAAGRLVDYLIGWKNLIAVYVLGGMVGSIASAVLHPKTVSVGASGAIFAMYGALIAGMIFSQRVRTMKAPQSILIGAGLQAFQSLANGLINHGVDNAAHIGGLTAGFLIMCFWYVNKNDPVHRLLTFGGSALAIGVFAISAFPRLVPVLDTNPVVMESKQKILFSLFNRVEGLERQFSRKFRGPDREAIKLKWFSEEFIPKFTQTLEELRASEPYTDSAPLESIRIAFIESTNRCMLLYSQLGNIQRNPASANGIPESTEICQIAVNERAATIKKAFEERDKKR